MTSLSRRNFNRLLSGAAIAPFFPLQHILANNSHPGASSWPGYSRAIVIDFLASPGPFNTAERFTTLSQDMVKNAVASGITAVNLTVGGGGTVEENFGRIAMWERELAANPDSLMKIRSASDLYIAKEKKKLGLMYGFQDASVLGTDLTRVQLFSSFGVRIIQLTYNTRNLIGDGCLESANGGLSQLGRNLVAELNDKRILIDLSHCGQQTTADGIKASAYPVAITHSGCTSVAQRPRNKRDEELRMMADKGGVIGIYMMPFLTMGKQTNDQDVIKHIEHAVRVCGEDHVGIGSDLSITPHTVTEDYKQSHREFVAGRQKLGIAAPGEDPDVFMFVPELNAPNRLELIADRLLKKGHTEARVEKIIGGNSARLLKEVWGG
ncbi:MAG: membrane dipeptidase [Cytophagales bacterium]|nr:membrane dipeptidase [Cytophagales bacterium]